MPELGIALARQLHEDEEQAFLAGDQDLLAVAGQGLDQVVTDEVAAELQAQETLAGFGNAALAEIQQAFNN